MTTQPACELIGHEGQFRLPGGRAVYDAVMYDGASARGVRPRLARLDTSRGYIRQINRYVDWDDPIEVIRDVTAEYDADMQTRHLEYDSTDGTYRRGR